VSEHCLVLTSEFPPLAIGGVGRYVGEVVPRLARRMDVTVVLIPTYEALDRWQHAAWLSARSSAAHGYDVQFAGTAYREALLGIDAAWDLRSLLHAAREVASPLRDLVGAGDTLRVYVQDYALSPIAAALHEWFPRAFVVAACHLPVYAGFTYFDKPVSDAIHQVLEAKLVHLADRVVVPSAFAAHVVTMTHNVASGKLAIISLGADRPRPATEPPDGPLRLLAVGRPTEQKGYHFLMEAVRRLSGSNPALRLTIVAGTDRCDRVHALADRAGVGACVDVQPCVRHGDMWGIIDRHHLLVTTSLYETFGLAVLEAMASRRPTLGFAVGALPEVWGEEMTAELGTPVACVDGLVARIEAVAGDAHRRSELGRRSENRARAFSWDRHVQALVALPRDTARAHEQQATCR
jgi:glycosyltransferase involved in cell wall biosynthesis